MRSWNLGHNVACILCENAEKTKNHIFFDCRISRETWKNFTMKFLGSGFTTNWDLIINFLTSNRHKYLLFLLRYVFQSTMYPLWLEKNRRRHGETVLSTRLLIKQIDKNVKNRINSIHNAGYHEYMDAMELWLSSLTNTQHNHVMLFFSALYSILEY